jgi:uncharacterized protein
MSNLHILSLRITSSMRRWFFRISLFLILLLLGTLGYVLWSATTALSSPPRRPMDPTVAAILSAPAEHGMVIHTELLKTPEGFATPTLICEPSRIPGTAVKGNLLRSQLIARGVKLQPWGDIRGTVVVLHGHTARRDSFIGVAERMCAAGFRCLLPDLPGHGDHPQPFTCYGATEKTLPAHLVDAAALARGFKPGPCYLFGYSMGGAIALQAAGLQPQRWRGVVSIASFDNLDHVVARRALHQYGALGGVLHGLVRPVAQLRIGFDMREVVPPLAIQHAAGPHYFILHGAKDSFVPPSSAQTIFDAIPGTLKQLWIIPEAAHGDVLRSPLPIYATIAEKWLGLE